MSTQEHARDSYLFYLLDFSRVIQSNFIGLLLGDFNFGKRREKFSHDIRFYKSIGYHGVVEKFIVSITYLTHNVVIVSGHV